MLDLCKESKYKFSKGNIKSGFPDPYIAATITDKDVAHIGNLGMKNALGGTVAKYFLYDKKQIGLEGDDYKKFAKLSESIQKTIRPTSTISIEAVEDHVFQWLSDRYSSITSDNLVEYILPKLEEGVEEFEICVPIGELRLESTIVIGRVQFRSITKELLDQWKVPLLEEGSEDEIRVKDQFFEEKMRKPHQGWPAAFIKLKAEPKEAQKIALYEIEHSLAILRVFTPPALIPQISSHVAVMGSEHFETVTIITFHNEIFASLSKEFADESQRILALDNNMIAQMYASGLATASQILCKNELTKFEQILLDALTLYSHATREKELASKIIYILASLESIFLKNDTESIQQNLRERIATVLGKNLGEKKNIIKNINAVYGTRSAFLHHAHSINQIEELEKFMHISFMALTTAIQNHARFPSTQEFIQAIDDLKLTGASTPMSVKSSK